MPRRRPSGHRQRSSVAALGPRRRDRSGRRGRGRRSGGRARRVVGEGDQPGVVPGAARPGAGGEGRPSRHRPPPGGRRRAAPRRACRSRRRRRGRRARPWARFTARPARSRWRRGRATTPGRRRRPPRRRAGRSPRPSPGRRPPGHRRRRRAASAGRPAGPASRAAGSRRWPRRASRSRRRSPSAASSLARPASARVRGGSAASAASNAAAAPVASPAASSVSPSGSRTRPGGPPAPSSMAAATAAATRPPRRPSPWMNASRLARTARAAESATSASSVAPARGRGPPARGRRRPARQRRRVVRRVVEDRPRWSRASGNRWSETRTTPRSPGAAGTGCAVEAPSTRPRPQVGGHVAGRARLLDLGLGEPRGADDVARVARNRAAQKSTSARTRASSAVGRSRTRGSERVERPGRRTAAPPGRPRPAGPAAPTGETASRRHARGDLADATASEARQQDGERDQRQAGGAAVQGVIGESSRRYVGMEAGRGRGPTGGGPRGLSAARPGTGRRVGNALSFASTPSLVITLVSRANSASITSSDGRAR